MDWLKEPIYEYISNHQQDNIDSVDIVQHFKLSPDITLEQVARLETENRIKREHYFGTRYRYVTT